MDQQIKILRDLYHSKSLKEQAQFLESLSPEAFNNFYYSSMILQDYQLVNDGDWRYFLFLAARGTGKTLTGAEWLADKHRKGYKKLCMVGATYPDLQKVMIPAFLARFPPKDRPKFISGSNNIIACKNGDIIHCLTLDNESSRGGNYQYIWVDEIVKACDCIPEKIQERFNILDFALRVGKAQMFISTTPKPMDFLINIVKRFEAGDKLIEIRKARTIDNKFLPPSTITALYEQYSNTRFGRQELDGELLFDVPGSLWNQDDIDNYRITVSEFNSKFYGYINSRGQKIPPTLWATKVAIGLDVPISYHDDSDEAGIIVVMLGSDGHLYVLEDASNKYQPNEWAKKCIEMFYKWKASVIAAEKNQGGLMVSNTIHTLDKYVPVELVHAKDNKIVRAEPVAPLYKRGLVHHVTNSTTVNQFQKLEEQMTRFDANPKSKSPDRMDALVYAIRELVFKAGTSFRDVTYV